MTGSTPSHVEVLTAEVRALMIGKRQVTLSVYRQLDTVEPEDCEPFGRVRDGQAASSQSRSYRPALSIVHVVGRSKTTGALVRARRVEPEHPAPWIERGLPPQPDAKKLAEYRRELAAYREWADLPLIVLAGLK